MATSRKTVDGVMHHGQDKDDRALTLVQTRDKSNMWDINYSQIMSPPWAPLPLKVGAVSPSSYGSAAHGDIISHMSPLLSSK